MTVLMVSPYAPYRDGIAAYAVQEVRRMRADGIPVEVITDSMSGHFMQRGEIDWFEQPPPEIQELLARNRDIAIELIDKLPLGAVMRLNHLHPPFDNVKARQAMLHVVRMADIVDTIAPLMSIPTPPARYSSNATSVTVCAVDASLVNVTAWLNGATGSGAPGKILRR